MLDKLICDYNGRVLPVNVDTEHKMDIMPDAEEKYARTAMLKIFSLLGEGHPLARKYRASLQRYAH